MTRHYGRFHVRIPEGALLHVPAHPSSPTGRIARASNAPQVPCIAGLAIFGGALKDPS